MIYCMSITFPHLGDKVCFEMRRLCPAMKSYILNCIVFIVLLLSQSSAASHGTYAFHTASFHDLRGRYSDPTEKSTYIPVESVFQRHPYRRAGQMTMSSRDEELERLQRENELLKRELKSTKGKPGKTEDKGFNPLKALGEIFLPKPKSGTDGGGKKRGDTEVVPEGERVGRRNRSLQRGQTDVGSALDRLFDDVPFPFNLAGGLVKGVASVMEESFQGSQDDTQLVIEATERTLRNDPTASQLLGGDVECLPPTGRSYSKTTINGVSSTSVGLQMPVRGSMTQGYVSVQASVGGSGPASEVTLRSVSLSANGRRVSVNTSSGGAGGGRSGGSWGRSSSGSRGGDGDVVDVDYVET